MLVPVDEFGGDHAVPDDETPVVDVVEEQVQCPEPLFQPAGHGVPFVAAHDARKTVDREDPLDGLLVAVDGKGDSLVEERAGDAFLDLPEVLGRRVPHGLEEVGAVTPGGPVVLEHLVVERRVVVVLTECRSSDVGRRGADHLGNRISPRRAGQGPTFIRASG